jgi:hypothetical protein
VILPDGCIVIPCSSCQRGEPCLYSDRDRITDPERDLNVDPDEEDAHRWERELARADVSRRDP